jgi:hypothetical protein
MQFWNGFANRGKMDYDRLLRGDLTMKRPAVLYCAVVLVSVMLVAGILLAQGGPDKVLVVNGKTAGVPILQLNGRSYIDLESLAEATNGSLAFEPNRIVLTLPATGSTSPAPAPGDAGTDSAEPAATAPALPPPPPPGLSREFSRAAVATLAEMREWRGATTAVVANGLPVVGTWPQDYRDRVDSSLRQATLVATTDADQDAVLLLWNEFANMEAWANGVVSARQALNAAQSVDPNALQNDTTLSKILSCGNFLGSMLLGGTFEDNASCH